MGLTKEEFMALIKKKKEEKEIIDKLKKTELGREMLRARGIKV